MSSESSNSTSQSERWEDSDTSSEVLLTRPKSAPACPQSPLSQDSFKWLSDFRSSFTRGNVDEVVRSEFNDFLERIFPEPRSFRDGFPSEYAPKRRRAVSEPKSMRYPEIPSRYERDAQTQIEPRIDFDARAIFSTLVGNKNPLTPALFAFSGVALLHEHIPNSINGFLTEDDTANKTVSSGSKSESDVSVTEHFRLPGSEIETSDRESLYPFLNAGVGLGITPSGEITPPSRPTTPSLEHERNITTREQRNNSLAPTSSFSDSSDDEAETNNLGNHNHTHQNPESSQQSQRDQSPSSNPVWTMQPRRDNWLQIKLYREQETADKIGKQKKGGIQPGKQRQSSRLRHFQSSEEIEDPVLSDENLIEEPQVSETQPTPQIIDPITLAQQEHTYASCSLYEWVPSWPEKSQAGPFDAISKTMQNQQVEEIGSERGTDSSAESPTITRVDISPSQEPSSGQPSESTVLPGNAHRWVPFQRGQQIVQNDKVAEDVWKRQRDQIIQKHHQAAERMGHFPEALQGFESIESQQHRYILSLQSHLAAAQESADLYKKLYDSELVTTNDYASKWEEECSKVHNLRDEIRDVRALVHDYEQNSCLLPVGHDEDIRAQLKAYMALIKRRADLGDQKDKKIKELQEKVQDLRVKADDLDQLREDNEYLQEKVQDLQVKADDLNQLHEDNEYLQKQLNSYIAEYGTSFDKESMLSKDKLAQLSESNTIPKKENAQSSHSPPLSDSSGLPLSPLSFMTIPEKCSESATMDELIYELREGVSGDPELFAATRALQRKVDDLRRSAYIWLTQSRPTLQETNQSNHTFAQQHPYVDEKHAQEKEDLETLLKTMAEERKAFWAKHQAWKMSPRSSTSDGIC